MRTILVVAALDTKGLEIAFCKKRIEELGAKALLIDGGVLGEPTIPPDITREEVAKAAGTTIENVRKIPAEAEALGLQTEGASIIAQRLLKEGKIHGVLGVGGGMGTALGTGVMRSLPHWRAQIHGIFPGRQSGCGRPFGGHKRHLHVPLRHRCCGHQ